MSDKLQHALSLIDDANARDPHLEKDGDREVPKELLYGQRMSDELARFAPDASAPLQIAARAQHIERWTSPRSDFPDGRAGYKKWRAQLGLFHAQRAAELAAEAGFDEDSVERVKYLVQKRGLKRDPETQTLEDVICLVFIRHYLDDFAEKHPDDKLVDIIQKTWAKMSEEGHQAALKIPLSDRCAGLVQRALS